MTEAKAKDVQQALQGKFGGQVDFESINGNGRYRFAIRSAYFDNMPQLTRQDQIWEVVDGVLSAAETLDISLILAYSQADLSHTT